MKSESGQLDWVNIVNERNVFRRGNAAIQNTPDCNRIRGVIELATVDIRRTRNRKQIGLSIRRLQRDVSIEAKAKSSLVTGLGITAPSPISIPRERQKDPRAYKMDLATCLSISF